MKDHNLLKVKPKLVVSIGFILLFCVACGKKGPLYLPKDKLTTEQANKVEAEIETPATAAPVETQE